MKSNDFAAAPQLHEKIKRSKDRKNFRHLAEWRSFFFAAILLVCFLDDDSHRVLSHMKGNAHRPSPLSESRNSRQACCALHPAPCEARLFYRMGKALSRIRKCPFQLCALGPVGPCVCAARLNPAMPLPVADTGIAGLLQRSKNARISVSPQHFSGTAR